jgi:hypothetical protein
LPALADGRASEGMFSRKPQVSADALACGLRLNESFRLP